MDKGELSATQFSAFFCCPPAPLEDSRQSSYCTGADSISKKNRWFAGWVAVSPTHAFFCCQGIQTHGIYRRPKVVRWLLPIWPSSSFFAFARRGSQSNTLIWPPSSLTMAGGHMKYRHLGRKSSHRQALLRNLVSSLFEHESITTTWPKAKEAQRLAEKLITLAKRNTEPARRSAQAAFYVRRELRARAT